MTIFWKRYKGKKAESKKSTIFKMIALAKWLFHRSQLVLTGAASSGDKSEYLSSR